MMLQKDVSVDYDICVIGGGPVGLFSAIESCLAGLKTCVFEPQNGVIDKACGEGLMPNAVKMLQDIGVHPDAHHPFKGIKYIDDNASAEGLFPNGVGWGIRRLQLHQALLKRIEELQIPIFHQKVQNFQDHQTYVQVENITARYVLAADGLHSSIRKKLGLNTTAKFPPRLGLRQHYHIAPWSDFVEVYWSQFGECYVTPVDETQIGVAILVYKDHKISGSSEESFEQMLNWFPKLQTKLKGLTASSTIRGAGTFEHRAKKPGLGNIFLVGDASGYLDPITGEGLRLGFASAKVAIQAISHSKIPLRQYCIQHQQTVKHYWISTGFLLKLRQITVFRRMMIPFLRLFPAIFSLILKKLSL